MRLFLLFFPVLLAWPACQKEATPPTTTTNPTVPPVTNPPHMERIDILALGDSYTKGQGVTWEKNFPNQLTDALKSEQYDVAGVHVIAQTGWRTDQLKSAIASQANIIGDSIFSLVTLCIGVNNQYQNADFEIYKKEFEQLLQTAIERSGGRKHRVFVLSIPDWAYTMYGQNYGDPAVTSQEIDQYNAANYEIAKGYEVNYVQVTDISRQGLVRPEFVAGDGLHPSAFQYTEWLKIMMPQVRDVLKK